MLTEIGIHFVDDYNKSKAQLISELQEMRNQASQASRKSNTINQNLKNDLMENEFKFRRFFEIANDSIFIFNRGGFVIDCNKKAFELLSYKKEKLIGKHIMFISTEYQPIGDKSAKMISEIKNRSCDGKSQDFEWTLKDKKNEIIPVAVSLFGFEDKEKSYMYGIVRDITKEKNDQERLRARDEITLNLLNTVTESFVLINKKNEIVFINETGAKRFKQTPATMKHKNLLSFFPDNISAKRVSYINEAFDTGKPLSFKDSRGKFHFFNQFYPIKNINGTVENLAIFGVDISKLKYTEQALMESEERFKAFMEFAPFFAYIKDKNLNHIFDNKKIKSLIEDKNKKKITDNDIFNKKIVKKLHEADMMIISGNSDYEELIFCAPLKGKDTWLRDIKFPIEIPGQGRILGGVCVDISEQKRSEEEIAKALNEKDILLAEIHHRIKNNLQITSSLINMQANISEDENLISSLKTTSNRIHTMGILHNKLYQSSDFSRIDVSDYVNSIIHQAVEIFQTPGKIIKYSISIDDIYMNIDTAVPCGLIINEIVTNSLKHAFNNSNSGKIEISIKTKNNKYYDITIHDSGIGFPEEINPKKSKSLGLQLVQSLIQQLHGNFFISNINPTFRSL